MSETRPEGMCKDCRVKPAAVRPDGTLASRCLGCAADRNEAAKLARAKARKRGLCAWEGGNCTLKAAKGKRYCAEHLAYHATRALAAKRQKAPRG